MNLQSVATAFKDTLGDWASAQGVQVYDFVPDSPNPPCIAIFPDVVPFDVTADSVWILWCVSGGIEEQGAQTRLLSWTSDTGDASISQVLDANHSLSGVVSSVLPLEARGYGWTIPQEGRPRLMQARLVYHVLR